MERKGVVGRIARALPAFVAAALLQALLPVSTAYGQNSGTDRVVTETTEEHPAVTVRLELEDYRFREGAADTAVAIVAEVEAGADRPQSEFGVFVYSIQVTNSATSGRDYEDVRTSLVFAPGDFSQVNGVWQGRKTVTLPVLDDRVAEGEEFLEMSLAPSNDFPEWASLVEPDSTTACGSLGCFVMVTIEDNDRVPSAPQSLVAVAGNGAVTLTWDSPADAGSSAVARYRYRYAAASSVPAGAPWNFATVSRTATIRNLDNGVEHAFEVQAQSDAGAGDIASANATPSIGTRYVSIQALEATVTEGSPARFRFHRTGSTEDALQFYVNVTGHKKIMSPATRRLVEESAGRDDALVTFPPGSSSATVALGTEADSVNEGDGEITVTLPDLPTFGILPPSAATVLVEDDDIPEVSLRWVHPPMTLQNDVWVGSMVEGEAIEFEVTCSGGTLAPENFRFRIPLRLQEVLNHPLSDYNTDYTYRWPCADQPSSHFLFQRRHGNRRYVGPDNGAIEVDLFAQVLSTASLPGGVGLFFTGGCYLDSVPGTTADIRFCPKFTLGAVQSARIEVLNRNPTITVEAVEDEVPEGEPARFRLTRHWTSDWLSSNALLGGETTVDFDRFATDGEGVTLRTRHQTSFGSSETEVIVELPTSRLDPIGRVRGVTLELIQGLQETQQANFGGHYEVYDRLEGITPPGGNSRVATVRVLPNAVELLASASALTVPEGGQRTYTMALETEPTGPVTVTPSVAGSPDVTVSPSELVFTAENWSQAQTVTVSAAQDADAANEAATISHAVSGAYYEAVTADDVAVTVEDDDTRGVALSATALTMPEGESRTYTVVLSSQPAGPVTVTPLASGSPDVTLSPSALTFTAETWDRAQTVTVSAAPDADAADDRATVSHAVSGGGYGSVAAAEVAVTVADDETASTGVTLTVSDEAVGEDAGATAITVTGTLNGAPGTSDTAVTVTVSGGTASAGDFAAVQDFTLTIGAGQASGTARFTLTPVDDAIDEGDETVRVAGAAQGLEVTPATVTIEDDDARGIAVSTGALTVPEGASRTYTVALRSQPSGPVTVTPSVAGSPDVTVSGALTFTAEDWDRAQTVTVSAGQDADAANDRATVEHTVSGGGYGSVAAADVAVTVEDDETASTRVVLTVSPPSVEEEAGPTPVTLTGTLDEAARTSDTAVTVTVSGGTASAGDFAAVQDFTLTIGAGQASGTARFTLTPVDDAIDEGDETVRVAGTAQGLEVTPATVTIEDDDARGIAVSTEALTVPEGDTRTYTVVLRSQPSGPVTVSPSVAGSPDVTVSPAALTFTAETWDRAQTVTVSAGQDADAANDRATVSHAVSGGGYGSVAAADVAVTVEEDDELGVTVTPTALTVPEGDTRTYTVVLRSQPSGPVTVSPSVAGSPDVTVSPAVLTFTAETWDRAQTVTVSAGQDADAANDRATVEHAVSGGGYGSVTAAEVAVTVADDETASTTVVLTVSPTSVEEDEDGTTITVTGTLNGAPGTSDTAVTVTVSGGTASAGDFAAVQDFTLTIGAGQASGTARFTLTPVDDAIDEGDETVRVAGAAQGLEVTPATVTIEDDDARGIAVSTGALTVPEGASRTYTVALRSQPSGPVTVTPSVAGSPDVTVSGALTFTAEDWDRAQTVTVSAGQDADAANDRATVEHAVSGGGYGSVTAADVAVTVEEDDELGVTVTPTALTVPEGDSRTYTVALRSQPSGPVTVTPSVAGSPDVTVSGALTFTAEDWDRAQTVTVSAGQDADAATDRATVEHTVSGGGYGSVTAAEVAVTVADDETASTGVTLTVSDEAVDEDAGATAITVTGTLNGAPGTSDTAVTVSVSGGTASTEDFAAVADFTLTIAAGQASGTARFTLTPVDDAIDEGDETVRVAGAAQGLEVTPATVTIEDDDARGIAVSTGALTVPEGASRTYTVALRSQPSGPVTVTPSVAGSPDVTVSGALTFTAEDWDRAQTVTVSAGQDADAATDRATVEHTVSGGGYGSVTAAEVAVTVADDETASTTVVLTVSPTSVEEDEDGTTITVTGTLNGAPGTSDTAVTVTVSGGTASAGDFAAVQDFTLTIGAGQASGTARFTLTPVDDAIDEGDETVRVAGTAQGLEVTPATVTIEDDDARGIAVSTEALTVPEGDTRTYTVVLRSQPSGPVTVSPSVAGSPDVTVSPAALTFTAETWDRAQTVTVSAGQDADAANDRATVSHAVSGGGYGSVAAADVAVTVEEDDELGVTVTPTALTVPEGDTRTYTVVLRSQPSGPVTVSPSVAGSPDVTVSPAVLTFTAETWDRAQTVTVSAGQDADAANDRATVEHAVSGGGYGSVTAAEVAVTVADDETASTTVVLTVSPTSVEEDEDGTTITVTGTLNGAPGTSDTAVTVTVSGGTASAGDFAAVQDFTLTIGAGQASGTARFTLTPVDDAIDEGDETVRVAGAAQGLEVTPATVTIEDDDARGIAVSTGALTVPEGASRTYTVALRSQPSGPVTVTPSVAGSPDVTVSGALTFTAEDWDRAQTVTVSAGQDADAANDRATVEHAVSGGGYGSVTAADVAVTVEEDDELGVTVTPTALTVPEGDSRTYTVALRSQPSGPVTVTPSVAGSPDVTVSGALTFTAEDWDRAQTVTVSAGQDADAANDRATVSHAVSGGGYGSVAAADVAVTVEEDDELGVTVTPTALTVPEGDTRTYTVVLRSQPSGPVTVSPSVAGSPDVTVSPAVLTFTAETWDRAQTVTVSAGQDADAANDRATVEHTVSGGGYGSVTAAEVAVTVADDETASTTVVLTVSPTSVEEDEDGTTITVTGTLNGAPGTSDTAVTVTVSGGTASAGDFAAVQDFTLTIGAGQASGTARFTLTPVDDAIDEGDETVRVAGTAQGLEVTPATVTIEDDDARGIAVSTGALTVPEGASRTYTVALRSQPSGPVTVTPSVAGSPDVTVSGALTFTAEDWDRAQTVTVSAGQDADAANDRATVEHTVSGGGYGSVAAADVAVTVEDDETASTRVVLTVSPPSVEEEAGPTPVTLTGTLDEAARTSDTAVTVTVSAGTASTEDFAAVADFTLTIAAGQTSGTATFTLTPVDDNVDEPEETIVVEGTTPGLEVTAATVSITNEDQLPKAWIARFGRTVAEQVLEAVESRMTAPRAPGLEVRLAGHRVENAATSDDGVVLRNDVGQPIERSLTGWPRQGSGSAYRSGFGSRPVSGSDLLTGSSFAFSKGTEESGLVSFWGRGAATRFDGRQDEVSLDGEVVSGILGTDWTRGDVHAGLILSHNRGEGGYRGASDSGSVSSTLTGLYPWGRYALSDRLSLWGVAGYGVGKLTLKPEGQTPIRTDLDLKMVSAGLRGLLMQAPETGGLELALKTDAFYVSTSTAQAPGMASASGDVTRLRLGLEGSRTFRFEDGSVLTPSIEIGVRHDAGDAETGFGLDLGGGLSWSDRERGLSAEARARGLLTHEAGGFRNRGISGSFSWDPGRGSGRGPKLALTQTLGASASGGMDALLGRNTLAGLAANDNGGGDLGQRRLELKYGYGFPAFGGRFVSTPEVAVGLSQAGREYRLGWRLGLAHTGPNALEFAVDATRREHANENADPDHMIGFRLRASF